MSGKAKSSANAFKGAVWRREYADHLQRDLARYADALLPDAEIYCLLLGVHPLGRIPDAVLNIVKYADHMNRAIRRFESTAQIHAEADRTLRGYLRDGAVIAAGSLGGGVAFGVPVDVCLWCIGPYRASDDLNILKV